MIHFIIDFENTGNQGLQGAGYLSGEDSVTIFYSKSNYNIERGRFQEIQDAHCKFDICKLKKPGKNALDFYIASRVGELYGSGYRGTVIIVSNDKGFEAVRDYWKSCAAHGRSVIIRPNIERGILASNENSIRFQKVRKRLEGVNLETEYLRYEERMKIRGLLEDGFGDTKYQNDIEEILNMVEKERSKKIVYLNSLKNFGRKDGLAIYNKVKQLIH